MNLDNTRLCFYMAIEIIYLFKWFLSITDKAKWSWNGSE